MALTYTPTSELEAINTMLGTIGQAPVNSLSGSRTADVSQAQTILHETSRDVQMQGWSFNTEKDYPLPRDGSGNIPIPANVMRLKVSRSTYSQVEPVIRGTKLYDRKNHTFTYTADLKAEKLVVMLAFDEMPEPARRYITIRAARVFSDRVLGDGATHVYTQADELNARKLLLAEFAEADDLNAGTAPSISAILWR